METRICVAGLTAVGKTFVAKTLARDLDAKYISASTLLLDSGMLLGYDSFTPHERREHFWLTDKAQRFNRQRLMRPRLDRGIDLLLLNYSKREKRIIIDSLTVPWLLSREHPSLKILLIANLRIRTERAWLSSQSLSRERLQSGIRLKDEATREILRRSWGFDIFSHSYMNCFDIVIDNSSLDNPHDIHSSEMISKETTTRIISSAVALYRYIICKEHASKPEAKLLADFQYLLARHPEVILRSPVEFLDPSATLNKVEWKNHETIWLRKPSANEMGSG